MGYFLGHQVIAEVDFAVEDAEVEVVAGAEFGFGQDEVVAFSAHHYPNGFFAGFENVFFYSVLFQGF